MDITLLLPFKNHPFKVKDDESMLLLMESIRKNGILSPILVVPDTEGRYRIISGHRRKHCAELLGYKKVPVIIRDMPMEECVISMVDSNLHREVITFREKAFAYFMKNEAMKRRAGRRKNDHQPDEEEMIGKRTAAIIGECYGDSARQVIRYIRLTKLIPELLDKLDEGIISFNPAVDLAYLSVEEQRWILDAMEYTQAAPSMSQARRIKQYSQEGILTLELAEEILGELKKGETDRVYFKNEQLYRYFPKEYTSEQIKKEILDILEQIYG